MESKLKINAVGKNHRELAKRLGEILFLMGQGFDRGDDWEVKVEDSN